MAGRLPDAVRAAVVRAVVVLALTLVAAMITWLGVWAGTWFWVPAMCFVGLGLLGIGWSALEILIAFQVSAEQRARERGVYRVGPTGRVRR